MAHVKASTSSRRPFHAPRLTKLCQGLNELWIQLESLDLLKFPFALERAYSITSCAGMKRQKCRCIDCRHLLTEGSYAQQPAFVSSSCLKENANVFNPLLVVRKDEEDICIRTLKINILVALVCCILAVQNYHRV